MDFLTEELHELRDRSLIRTLKSVEGAQGKYVTLDGRRYLAFCSNNYLDLANHADVMKAAIHAIEKYGWGAGASRLVSGNTALHEELENEIAGFKGTEDAIVFPTGYMANVGTISSLTGKGDMVASDRLNHASIIDGCRMAQASLRIYPHRDTERLERILSRSGNFNRKLIITDTVFSMDGDLAPIREIVNLANKHDAITMVDEAHATGVFGKCGRGVMESEGLEGRADVVMGTLSKSVGSIGGFVCGNRDLIEYLRNRAKSFIYTTALPPAVCAASIEGLRIIRTQPGIAMSLWRNIGYIRTRLSEMGIDTGDSQGPIIPIMTGDIERTNALSRTLFDNNILVPAIRPPTVPDGSCRLRVTVMASHTTEEIDRFVDLLSSLLETYGIPAER